MSIFFFEKIVEKFGDDDIIKVNHYVNPDKVDLSTASTRTIAVSYNNNKVSAQKIGDHMFWWDKTQKNGKPGRDGPSSRTETPD